MTPEEKLLKQLDEAIRARDQAEAATCEVEGERLLLRGRVEELEREHEFDVARQSLSAATINSLRTQNEALSRDFDELVEIANRLRTENAALAEDKGMLDWIDKKRDYRVTGEIGPSRMEHNCCGWMIGGMYCVLTSGHKTLRSAIRSAMSPTPKGEPDA